MYSAHLQLYRDPTFSFQIHIVEQLLLHISLFYSICSFKQSISQSTLAMICKNSRKYQNEGSFLFILPIWAIMQKFLIRFGS